MTQLERSSSINRNIMECKVFGMTDKMAELLVLIET